MHKILTETDSAPHWLRRHWLIATAPPVFFAVSNYVQNFPISGGFGGAAPATGWFFVFIAAYALFALSVRVCDRLRPGTGSRAALLIRGGVLPVVWGFVFCAGHLFVIAALTARVRSPADWTAKIGFYYAEIVWTCAPVWILVFAATMAALRLPNLRARPEETGGARLELSTRTGRVYVASSEIELVRADGNGAEIHCGGRTISARTSITEIEARLAACGFIRLHRSFLAPGGAIEELQRLESGAYRVKLSSGAWVPVSRRRLNAVRRALSGGGRTGTFATV